MAVSSLVTGVQSQGDYFQWGVFSISAANAVVIAVMLLLFVLAVVVPFPKGKAKR